jgi:hypothetical protein
MTTSTQRPSLNDMVKAAMAGTQGKLAINADVTRQLAGGSEKTASAAPSTPGHISTDRLHKLASAAAYCAAQLLKEAEESQVGVGKGSTALPVSETPNKGENVDAGGLGEAKPQHVVSMSPATEAPLAGGASNAMKTTETGETSTGAKVASPVVSLIRKLAEDNAAASISASAVGGGPLQTMETGEAGPGLPAESSAQAALVGSNERAIDYTRAEAKAGPKRDMAELLTEPMQSESTDKTLAATLENTSAAGAKVAAAREGAIKVAAAQAIISKLAKAVDEKNKQKLSGGTPAAPNTPAQASGFSAQNM